MAPEPSLLYQFRPTVWSVSGVSIVTVVVLTLVSSAGWYWLVRQMRVRPPNRLGLAISAIWAILPGVIAIGHLSALIATIPVFDHETWQVVCGHVGRFQTAEEGNTGRESFSVAEVPFKYSDYGSPGVGYRTTLRRGGIFREGMNVRLHFVQIRGSNVIVRVESLPEGFTGPCQKKAAP